MTHDIDLSTLSHAEKDELILSLAGFIVFYSALAIVDAFLLVRTIRRGPDGLGIAP